MEVINILCVKEGDKYSADYVNRLHLMCRLNTTRPMRFMCYTDDPSGIDKDIEILPIPDEFHIGGWWDKMGIFRKGLIPEPNGFPILYLDLDTVIQKNLDELITFGMERRKPLTGIYLHWDNIETDGEYKWKTLRHKIPFNSSVMMFYPRNQWYLWDKFWAHHDDYIFKYYGDDKFLAHEAESVRHWPKGWIYSRLYGIDEDNRWNILTKVPEGSQEVCYYPDATICLLNGPTNYAHYKDLEHYWMHK